MSVTVDLIILFLYQVFFLFSLMFCSIYDGCLRYLNIVLYSKLQISKSWGHSFGFHHKSICGKSHVLTILLEVTIYILVKK